MSKDIFISICNNQAPNPAEEDYSVVTDINSSMTTATTFKKIYTVGLQKAGIDNPDLSYRQALERYKAFGHVYVRPLTDLHDDDRAVMITRIRLH